MSDCDIFLVDKTDEEKLKVKPTPRGPLEIPEDGIFDLGPRNGSSVLRFATLVNRILRERPKDLPPNQFVMYVARRITGSDKQDFSMIMSGRKGLGKSYSSLQLCLEIAKEIAKILRKEPEDFFTLANCCLLEDSEGINKIIKTAGMHQIILIDDAGVAVGSRDFATTKNKNFNTLLSTCRTKRWVIIFNVPAKSHLDKVIRELVDAWSTVFKPFHDLGFNIVKINSVTINERLGNKAYGKRYEFGERKVDMWAVRAPPKKVAQEYDIRRDAAAQKIIDACMTGDEAPKLTTRDLKRIEMREKYGTKIAALLGDGVSATVIRRQCPGLSNTMLETLRGELGV